MIRDTRVSLIFLVCNIWAFHLPVAYAHILDTDSLTIVGVGNTATFTLTDPAGCTAITDVSADDITLISVSPRETGPVVSQTYTVTAWAVGETHIVVFWAEATTELCPGDSGAPRVQVSVVPPPRALERQQRWLLSMYRGWRTRQHLQR